MVSGSTAPLTTANPQVIPEGAPDGHSPLVPKKLKKVRAPLLLADGSAPAWPSLAQLVDEPVPHRAACLSLAESLLRTVLGFKFNPAPSIIEG